MLPPPEGQSNLRLPRHGDAAGRAIIGHRRLRDLDYYRDDELVKLGIKPARIPDFRAPKARFDGSVLSTGKARSSAPASAASMPGTVPAPRAKIEVRIESRVLQPGYRQGTALPRCHLLRLGALRALCRAQGHDRRQTTMASHVLRVAGSRSSGIPLEPDAKAPIGCRRGHLRQSTQGCSTASVRRRRRGSGTSSTCSPAFLLTTSLVSFRCEAIRVSAVRGETRHCGAFAKSKPSAVRNERAQPQERDLTG